MNNPDYPDIPCINSDILKIMILLIKSINEQQKSKEKSKKKPKDKEVYKPVYKEQSDFASEE